MVEFNSSFNSSLTLWLPSSKSTFSQPFKEKCVSVVVRTGSIIIWNAKFLILYEAIFLVRRRWNLKLITFWGERVQTSRKKMRCSRPLALNSKWGGSFNIATFSHGMFCCPNRSESQPSSILYKRLPVFPALTQRLAVWESRLNPQLKQYACSISYLITQHRRLERATVVGRPVIAICLKKYRTWNGLCSRNPPGNRTPLCFCRLLFVFRWAGQFRSPVAITNKGILSK